MPAADVVLTALHDTAHDYFASLRRVVSRRCDRDCRVTLVVRDTAIDDGSRDVVISDDVPGQLCAAIERRIGTKGAEG